MRIQTRTFAISISLYARTCKTVLAYDAIMICGRDCIATTLIVVVYLHDDGSNSRNSKSTKGPGVVAYFFFFFPRHVRLVGSEESRETMIEISTRVRERDTFL